MANVKIGNRTFNGIEGVVLNNQTSGNTLYSLMDWGENSHNQPNYVKNRPFWIQNKSYSWSGTDNSTNSFDPPEEFNSIIASKLNWISSVDDNFVPELMVGGSVTLNLNGTTATYPIEKYIATITQYQHFMADYGEQPVVGIINGQIMGFPASVSIGIVPITADTSIMIFMTAPANTLASDSPAGLYAFKYNHVIDDATTETYYLTNLKFNDIIINKDYGTFFDYFRNPIYIMPVDQITEVLNQDLSNYNTGDLILLVSGNPL